MKNLKDLVPYTWRHPIKHWRWMHKAKKQRLERGFCDADVWNMDRWFLVVVPPMLRELAEEGAFPDQYFETFEDWRDWLVSLAEAFESCTWDALEDQNEYRDDHNDTRYYTREIELEEQAKVRLQDAMTEMGKHFLSLWS